MNGGCWTISNPKEIRTPRKFTVNDDIKTDINSKFNTYLQNITQVLFTIQGDDYRQVSKYWEKLDYDRVELKFDEIANDYERFILKKIENEKNEINQLLKENIRNNFQIVTFLHSVEIIQINK